MSKFNKSYRIRTDVGKDTSLYVKLDREYDVLEIMSLKINQSNAYKLHTSEYGVIAGRVLANDAFGIPNAKISVFISTETDINDIVKTVLYPYNTTSSKNKNNIRYNLLPDEQVSNCHTIIGTFPEKQYMLDNDDILEIFDKYYKYTTRTNNAGDFMIFGVPVGSQTVHVDIDLSDIGILSQKPRDMVYKGYNVEQFENPNKFKHSTNLESLTQVISQDNVVDVIPFWGDEDEGTIGISRCDINIQYKFEPTCVFMGSVVSDTASNGISKKCIPTPGMGAMDEITTGSGTIEMIRKTPSGDVEEYQIKGTQLINGDGVWCYQIPMNLDYMMTDEFGNMVPTNDPDKGVPTRTRVRFRISMQDFDSDSINMFRGKMLVPHNPDIYSDNCLDELDYDFGTNTKESSYRDLFWNCVYSVKSYIPRIQKGSNWRNEKFTGFKRVNYYNDKNPIPYNNIRIRIPFMYSILCVIIKAIISITGLVNRLLVAISSIIVPLAEDSFFYKIIDGIDKIIDLINNTIIYVINLIIRTVNKLLKKSDEIDELSEITTLAKAISNSGSKPGLLSLSGELCNEDLEHLCIIPGININDTKNPKINSNKSKWHRITLLSYTILKFYQKVTGNNPFYKIIDNDEMGRLDNDAQSIDFKGYEDENYKIIDDKNGGYNIYGIRVTNSIDYLIQCIEMNLAQEFKVIQFDFYNDWINGLIYIPRWARKVTRKFTFLGIGITKGGKIKACNENFNSKRRNIVQQCGLKYRLDNNSVIDTPIGCDDNKNKCHKSKKVRLEYPIFKNSGLINSKKTLKNQYVYYFKPYDNDVYDSNGKNIRLFATDIILLGSMNDSNEWGIPNILKEMVSSTYQMPPNLALTDSDIEGDGYETERVDGKSVNPNNNYIWIKFDDKDICNDFNFNKCFKGITPFEETGSYTEISGINWNYTGPLQDKKSGTNPNMLYKPGGHFLGISCTNPETTVKTCVNLSRICEYGVPMSQREVLNVPMIQNDKLIIKSVATVPTGFINSSDINDGEFRRIFASLNNNRLRTVKDKKTNYLRYDFKWLNPIGFGGELYDRIMWNYEYNDTAKNLNRHITDKVYEKDYSFDDDNFFYYTQNEGGEILVSETQIMRTNENRDDEYFKFRFGYTENNLKMTNFSNDDVKNKRYLYNNIEEESGRINSSFPMYNNSFYFYFGLHDGRTALDEFKKNYYAVCEKNTLNYIDGDNDIDVDKEKYLTIEALDENLTVKFSKNCFYSSDCILWNILPANIETTKIRTGEKIYFKATDLTPTSSEGIGTFTISKKCNLSGNCNSMLFGDDADFESSLKDKKYAFYKLFYNCNNIIGVSSDFLPATELDVSCYCSMFAGCTSLKTAPELPVTTLAKSCYKYMFSRCSSLTETPKLPATTLTENCYDNMFYGCTSLVTVQELPAKTMFEGCYYSMFEGCTNLTKAPELPATTLAKSCYEEMFKGCTKMKEGPSRLPALKLVENCYFNMFQNCISLENAPELDATELYDGCYYQMFMDCISLKKGPTKLPASTLAKSCYEEMFKGCTKMKEGPSRLPALKLVENCYFNMFQGCDSLTTAPELDATELYNDCYYQMFMDCISLKKGPTKLPATTLANNCYEEMFKGCTSLETAPELPATTLAYWCYEGMFRGCTSLKTAPELPATILESGCYENMFYGCSKLNYIKALFNHNIIIDGGYEYTFNWVKGVASTGTFVKNINANWNVIGENGIPEGWVKEFDGEPEYLNIEFFNSDCRISFSQHAAIEYREYGSNSKYWNILPSNSETQLVGKYEFRRRLDYDGERSFRIKGPCNIGGCVMSVLYKGDEFREKYNIIEDGYSLKNLFRDCTGIESVSPGLLPATTLSDECYEGMFQGCTSLENAPELPAPTLTNSCYRYMFEGCYSLTTAPVLPATTLTDYCYEYMFKGCSDLNYIKALFLTEPNDNYTFNWVKGVASTGKFEQNNNATWIVRGTNGVPENWTLMRGGAVIKEFDNDVEQKK